MEMNEILEAANKTADAKEDKKEIIENIKPIELTPEQEEEIIFKRFGVGSKDLIKKEEQIKVLSPEEKLAEEEKRQSEILEWALKNNKISAKGHEEYIAASKTDKVELAKKVIEELGDEVSSAFNSIFKIDEDDELVEGEGEAEKLVPNKQKIGAKKVAEKLADSYMESKYGAIKNLPNAYEQYLAEQVVIKNNTAIINKAVASIPKRIEMEEEGVKFGIDISDEDFKEAKEMAMNDVLTKDGLTEEDAKNTLAAYLFTKNAKRAIGEGIRVGVAKSKEAYERGQKGLLDNVTDTSTEDQSEGALLLEKIRKEST